MFMCQCRAAILGAGRLCRHLECFAHCDAVDRRACGLHSPTRCPVLARRTPGLSDLCVGCAQTPGRLPTPAPSAADSPGPPVNFTAGAYGGGFGAIGPAKLAPRAPSPFGGPAGNSFNAAPGRSV